MAYNLATGDFVTTNLIGSLAAAATTATIGTGLDIPATNGVLQIDYDSTTAVGSDNGPETVTYATYTTGTGALTGLSRGADANTTDVAHANNASVQAGPSTLIEAQFNDRIISPYDEAVCSGSVNLNNASNWFNVTGCSIAYTVDAISDVQLGVHLDVQDSTAANARYQMQFTASGGGTSKIRYWKQPAAGRWNDAGFWIVTLTSVAAGAQTFQLQLKSDATTSIAQTGTTVELLSVRPQT